MLPHAASSRGVGGGSLDWRHRRCTGREKGIGRGGGFVVPARRSHRDSTPGSQGTISFRMEGVISRQLSGEVE